MNVLKNIDREMVLQLSELVDYKLGQIVSRTLIQNKAITITLFAFDTNEQISSHTSDGDALVHVLTGSASIRIGTKDHILRTHEAIVMPAGVSHAITAPEPMRLLLVVVFP